MHHLCTVVTVHHRRSSVAESPYYRINNLLGSASVCVLVGMDDTPSYNCKIGSSHSKCYRSQKAEMTQNCPRLVKGDDCDSGESILIEVLAGEQTISTISN